MEGLSRIFICVSLQHKHTNSYVRERVKEKTRKMVELGPQGKLRWDQWPLLALALPRGSTKPHRATVTGTYEMELTRWPWCSQGFMCDLLPSSGPPCCCCRWCLCSPDHQSSLPNLIDFPSEPWYFLLCFPPPCPCPHWSFFQECPSPHIWLPHLQALNNISQVVFTPGTPPFSPTHQPGWCLPTVAFYGTLSFTLEM